ncbi:hypothetical protein HY638_00680 [Candidatus Woesearchaeota archaeon]|nr:hypothetical protein [Candidatus Woesearchaeota archaeon]
MQANSIKKIRKRNNEVVDFDQEKIANAIFKAAESVGGKDKEIASNISDDVVEDLNRAFNADSVPTVEEIQDTVEKVLIKRGYADTAKAYILYRSKRSELRKAKFDILGKVDDSLLTANGLLIAKARYLLKDKEGNCIETPNEMFSRVAHVLSDADKKYEKSDAGKINQQFYEILSRLEFVPGGRTLAGAGTKHSQLSNCFVIPIEDSMEGIFQAVMEQALVQKVGGGTGFSFSRLRPKGSRVVQADGVASGPVSFIHVFDAATEVIRQGGNRRGANMGSLSIEHPDIIDFITSKDKSDDVLKNFNISVEITEKFMDAVINNRDYDLIDPSTKKAVERMSARKVFDLLVTMAWKNGDPGLLFMDRINRDNPCPKIGRIETTNPCVAGETYVSTEKGLVQIKDIVGQGIGIAANAGIDAGNGLMQKGIIMSHTNGSFRTGTKETFRITTEAGFEITTTKEHKILTTDGWKEACELTINDHVLLQCGEGKFNENAMLGNNAYAGKWSAGLGQIIGWLVGDGWLRKGKNCRVGFVFGKDDMEIYAYLEKRINRLYGKNIRGIKRYNGVMHLSYHSIGFVEFFEALGVKAERADKKVVPHALFTAPRDAVVGFLQGLFSSDGTISTNNGSNTNYIRLTSKSRELLNGVQLLLINLGIKSRIYERHRNRRITFSYRNTRGELRLYESDGILFELQVSKDMIPLFLEKVGFLCGKNAGKVKHLSRIKFHSTKFEERVVSIEPQGEREVFDLTEPVTHSFIGNGIVVHNCGEQPLLPYEACNLGSINLSLFVDRGKVNWERLRYVTRTAVRMLDDVVDASKFPIDKIAEMVKYTRRIGLGVLGWGDMLYEMEIPYDSEEAVKLAEEVMGFIQKNSREASRELADEKGAFPAWELSVWKERGIKMRNSAITTIAPTGTLSMLVETSGGIEPNFAIAYVKRVMGGTEIVYVNRVFENIAKERGFYSEELMRKIAKRGTLHGMAEIPEDVRRVFVTAHDITPEWHVRMQAAFQRNIDNACSKTVNLPNDATIKDVEEVYLLAYKLGCKGVTVYRDGSKANQVMNIESVKGKTSEELQRQAKVTELVSELKRNGTYQKSYEKCPECGALMVFSEGCLTCPSCAYSKCTI